VYLVKVLLRLVLVLELADAELPGERVAPVLDPGLRAVAVMYMYMEGSISVVDVNCVVVGRNFGTSWKKGLEADG
jgi:hypothetical protein